MRIVSPPDQCLAHDAAPLTADDRIAVRKLSVMMPIFNERWTLEQIIQRVLSAPVSVPIELLAVDDASSDGSWEVLSQLAAADSRIKPIRHLRNRGKGAAIRTAIEHITGDVAVVQDADLEYDPAEFPLLLQPFLEGKADAVFGSRFAGHPRRVLSFWHTQINRGLTLLSNIVNDLTLTDMETCYKMVRTDVLKSLRLRSRTFTLEPELTARLAQWGARIYEVPISYSARGFDEGKKIRARDGLKAIGTMLWTKWFDPRFTDDAELYHRRIASRCMRRKRWVFDLVRPYIGCRVLEIGAGRSGLSSFLLGRERLVLAEVDQQHADQFRQRFGHRPNLRVECSRLATIEEWATISDERLDTVLCQGALEHTNDDLEMLTRIHALLEPGGRCIVVTEPEAASIAPVRRCGAGPRRHYTQEALYDRLHAAGFTVVASRDFDALGPACHGAGRWFFGGGARPRALVWADRLVPLTKLADRILPLPGGSLVVVGQKPDVKSQKAAA
ncbi:MAG: glycosyltransferase [Planctomycetota bacterium]